MKIISWNINSIRMRQDHVLRFLQTHNPDALFLQEIKTEDFQSSAFEDLGYRAAVKGQKAYNGVVTLSRLPMQIITDTLPGDPSDTQSRFMDVQIGAMRLINIYAPNGNPVESEKFPYKLAWLQRLYDYLLPLRQSHIPFLVGGDFNIIPQARDCYDPVAWEGDALFRIESRQAWRRLLNLGLYDALRLFDQSEHAYTFWDYQAGCWPANKGIRIDHFLLSPDLADRAQNCWIDREPRGWDKPSDHTAIGVDISAI